jgi:hypothetical protein
MGRVRAHIGDSHLKRRVPSRGAQIPPQLAGVLHHPGIDKDLDVALVVNPGLEHLRSPVRGIPSKTERRKLRSPVSTPCQNGDDVERASMWGKK